MNPFLQFLMSQQPMTVSGFPHISDLLRERDEEELMREVLSRIRSRRFRNPFMRRNPFSANSPFDVTEFTPKQSVSTPSPKTQGVGTVYDARPRRY